MALFHYSYAQVEVEDFSFGFELSPTISWVNTDDNRINNNGSNLGVKLGTTGEYMLSENYSLTGSVFFVFNQGGQVLYEVGGNLLPNTRLSEARFNEEGLPDNVNIRYKIQFVELPIGFKMRTNQIGNIRYFAHFPEMAMVFNTQARANLTGGPPSNSVDLEDENINKEVPFLRFKWAVTGGAEYQIGGNTYLVGGIGFQSTFGDILKGRGVKNNGERDDSSAKIRSLILKLGVRF